MQWSNKYDKCIECEGRENKHYALGMCTLCYSRHRWKTKPEYRQYIKEYTGEWRKKHKDEWSEINRRAIKKFRDKNHGISKDNTNQ